MIDNNATPTMPDDMGYYMVLPQRATMYGADCVPARFVRVVSSDEGDVRFFTEYTTTAEDPTSRVSLETVDMSTFLRWASFGYTPYAECMLSKMRDSIDFSPYSQYFLSQATLRSYEQRCRTLIDLCKGKRLSISSLGGSDTAGELVAEVTGAIAAWEMLMNTGTILAHDCLHQVPPPSGFGIPVKEIERRFLTLQNRMVDSNHVYLPYKITEDKRNQLISALS